MIANHVRRIAFSIQNERGGSLQDILQEIVSAARGGKLAFHARMVCMMCGSTQIRVQSTRPAIGITTRAHRCDFCGATFQSEEKIQEEKPTVQNTVEKPAPIEKPRKKPQNRNRKS